MAPKRLVPAAASDIWIGSEQIIELEPNVTVKLPTTMLALIALFSMSSTLVYCEFYVVERPVGISRAVSSRFPNML
jgi:hypothetical protein